MARLLTCPILLAVLICVGCGQSEPTANSTAVSSPSDSTASQPSPTDIVSQFLDEVRRGGANSGAGKLLTVKAQEELKRIGLSVQPIGSPAARFEVTRGEPVPGEEGAMLVHSLWTEPNEDGTKSQFQVVWAVQLESAGWRISGMAMELQPGVPPTVIDFENGNLMAQTLAPPATNNAAQTNAAQTSPGQEGQMTPPARDSQAAFPAGQPQLK